MRKGKRKTSCLTLSSELCDLKSSCQQEISFCFLCTNEGPLTNTYGVKYETSLLTLWFDYVSWDWEFKSSLLRWFIAWHETSKLLLEQSVPIDQLSASEVYMTFNRYVALGEKWHRNILQDQNRHYQLADCVLYITDNSSKIWALDLLRFNRISFT